MVILDDQDALIFKQYNILIIKKDNISNAIFDFFKNKFYFRYMEILDITLFEKALTSLESILNRYKKDNFDIDIRDTVIQRFIMQHHIPTMKKLQLKLYQ